MYIMYIRVSIVWILGFLLDFISLPVITGFTAAASINIAASQIKPLLGIPGRSEDLVDALISVFSNLNDIRYQDTSLGVATIIILVLLKVYLYASSKIKDELSDVKSNLNDLLYRLYRL